MTYQIHKLLHHISYPLGCRQVDIAELLLYHSLLLKIIVDITELLVFVLGVI